MDGSNPLLTFQVLASEGLSSSGGIGRRTGLRYQRPKDVGVQVPPGGPKFGRSVCLEYL